MGQASRKKRDCPAVGRTISPAECGENRNSRYTCPADCPFNPLAPQNYDQLLQLEDEVDSKTVRFALENDPSSGILRAGMRKHPNDPARNALVQHGGVAWELFFHADDAGKTPVQHWEEKGFPGLKNDERVLAQAKMRMRVTLLEIRTVLDDQTLEAADLLAPEESPFRIVDRSMAARAVRFSHLLIWLFPLPHFWRTSGAAISMPDIAVMAPADILRETVRHLGARLAMGETPGDSALIPPVLLENIDQISPKQRRCRPPTAPAMRVRRSCSTSGGHSPMFPSRRSTGAPRAKPPPNRPSGPA